MTLTINSVDMVQAAMRQGLSGSALIEAISVSLAENASSDPKATHKNSDGSTDYGLWQINSIHGYNVDSLLTPDGNAKAMYEVSKGGKDWSPWSTYPAKSQAQIGEATKLAKLAPEVKTVEPKDATIKVGGILNPLEGINSIASSIGSIASHLLDSKWWLRVGQGLAGAALLLIALGLIFRKQIIRGAAAVATDGLSEAT